MNTPIPGQWGLTGTQNRAVYAWRGTARVADLARLCVHSTLHKSSFNIRIEYVFVLPTRPAPAAAGGAVGVWRPNCHSAAKDRE